MFRAMYGSLNVQREGDLFNSPRRLFKRTLYSEKNMNSLNVEYFLAMNIQNLDKNR